MLFGCFIPFQVVLVPMAQVLGKLGLANSTAGLVLVHTAYGLGFTTLFFRNYYEAFPNELIRAAMIDGARSAEHTSELQSLMRISYAVFCLKKKTYHDTIVTYIINKQPDKRKNKDS